MVIKPDTSEDVLQVCYFQEWNLELNSFLDTYVYAYNLSRHKTNTIWVDVHMKAYLTDWHWHEKTPEETPHLPTSAAPVLLTWVLHWLMWNLKMPRQCWHSLATSLLTNSAKRQIKLHPHVRAYLYLLFLVSSQHALIMIVLPFSHYRVNNQSTCSNLCCLDY